MLSRQQIEQWLFFRNRQNNNLSAAQPQTQSEVKYDEDGDVIMRDAPGANPELPLIEQWVQINGPRR